MKTILVTGGTGFLGSNLCIRLINEGNKVIYVDNNYTGRLSNIESIANNPNFRFIEHDICDLLEINDEKIDQIYNMACPASPPAYQGSYSIKTTKTCVFGAINMLELAKQHNATILQTSTSEIYGEPLVHPQVETYWGNVNPIGIRSCYDEGKRCAETLMMDYHRQKNVDIRIARIFNTYGPRMALNDGRVVSNFIVQALRNELITVYGTGSQTRAFCYVSDLVDALIKLMESNYDKPVNLGNPDEHTILEFAKLIIELTNSKSEIIFKELPSDDPTQREPNISIAKETLKWEPKIQIKEGLLKTIEYFDRIIHNK